MFNKSEKNNETPLDDSAREEKISELEILGQSLKDKQTEVEKYHDQLLRLKAEFENYRKRTEKEKQRSFLWGKEEVLLRFISVMDIFSQAENHVKAATDIKSVQQGIGLIKVELENFLRAEGITMIGAVDEKFDTSIHEAVERVESDDVSEERVVEEIQKGYKFNDTLIRPAKVKVVVPKKEKINENNEEVSNNE